MDANLRRIMAMSRDNSRFRVAHARQAGNRFDVEAAKIVRQRVESLLETLSFIGQDDALWRRLTEAAEVLSTKHLDALSLFDDMELGAMLVATGYRSPPPPPVEELIADTRHALALALDAGPSPDLVGDARRSLIMFTYRARRQVQVIDELATSSNTITVVGRRAASVARDITPIALGAAAGAITEAMLPGTGVGVGTGMGVKKVAEKGLSKFISTAAEKGTELAALAAMGYAVADPPPHDLATGPDELVTPDQAIAAHVASARAILSAFIKNRYDRHGRELDDIDGHLRRIVELSHDHQGPSDLEHAAKLALDLLDEVGRRLSEPWRERRSIGQPVETETVLALAAEAVDICVEARGEPSEFYTPTYSSRPFDPKIDMFADDSADRARRHERLLHLRSKAFGGDERARAHGRPSSESAIGVLTHDDNEQVTRYQHGY